MFKATSKNRLNISHKRTPLGLTLVVLVLCVVLTPLLYEHWVSRSPMFFAERRELQVHAPTRTIVSISTFSQRVFNMRWCLDTVFAQSQLPDRIIISIPRKFRVLEPTTGTDASDHTTPIRHNETELDIVAWFSEYSGVPAVYRVNVNVHKTSYVYEMGILTVQFLDDDPWGPGTKLVGALLLEKDPETVIITLDDGTEVRLKNTDDCCAYTELEAFLLHPEKVDHIIMGVGTTEEYSRWHIYADHGDILELTVGWSCGNPFYYGYGFDIDVVPA